MVRQQLLPCEGFGVYRAGIVFREGRLAGAQKAPRAAAVQFML